jgi:hypothetical protein
MAVCSDIHTKHKNTLCGQKVEIVNFKTGGTYLICSARRALHVEYGKHTYFVCRNVSIPATYDIFKPEMPKKHPVYLGYYVLIKGTLVTVHQAVTGNIN